jgi:Protein of unknown function (DUF1353)
MYRRGSFRGRVLVEPATPVVWRLWEELRYQGDEEEFIVPQGFLTDFATIPRIAVWLIPRFGAWTKAAVLHDWLLVGHVRKGLMSSVDADNLFRRVLREEGVPPYRRNLMWTGVRWAALFSKYRRPGWFSTFPAMMFYTIVFLLTIIPPLTMLVVAVALAVHGAVELVISAISPKDDATSGSLST